MIKRIAVMLVIMLVAASVISFAEEPVEVAGAMKGKEMKGDMSKKHGMMKMMHKKLVATDDGGVVLMMGNKLIKYDDKLNLVNEVEIKKCMPAEKSEQERPVGQPEN